MSATCDLLVRAHRVVCPDSGWDAPADVAIAGGRIVAVQATYSGNARRVVEYPTGIVLPGLVDLHAHPARSGSKWGVDPDPHFIARGTTTVLSQGDAGAEGLEDYVRTTIEPARTRVALAINLLPDGASTPTGVEECVAAINRFSRHIWGISVNASRASCGKIDPRRLVARGLEVAQRTRRPILYGMRCPEDWPLAEQLELLRAGDVVTYLYRRTPHCIVESGRVIDAVRAARRRGVRFDVGHGMGSFDFEVAAAAISDGFGPDTISTDLQRAHLDRAPVHDLPLVMSKLRAAGMAEGEIYAAVTATPAKILGRAGELGVLQPGARADLTVLEWNDEPEPLVDVNGLTRRGGRWSTLAVIKDGEPVPIFSSGNAGEVT